MKNLDAIKTAGQEQLNRLAYLGQQTQQQPSELQIWGVTAGAAAAGGLLMFAGSRSLLAIVSGLSAWPVSLTLGAVGGGVLGWRYMEQYMEQQKATKNAVTLDEIPIQSFTADVPMTDVPTEIPVTQEIAIASLSESIQENSGEILSITLETSTEPNPNEVETTVLSDEPPSTKLESVPTPIDTESSTPSSVEVSVPVISDSLDKDNLNKIVGIGPVFANRLHTVGIDTFAQLAAMTPERLLEIMSSSRGGHMIDAAAWIEQANQLVADTNT